MWMSPPIDQPCETAVSLSSSSAPTVTSPRAGARPLEQELEGDRRLAGPGRSLEQENPIARQATDQDVVQAGDPQSRFFGAARFVVHPPLRSM